MRPSGHFNLPEVADAIHQLDARMYLACFEDLFEHGNGVTRRLVPARKDEHNPVFTAGKPWEGNYVGYPSVWKDPERGCWRMWYATKTGVALAEGDDGVHWERPELGRIEFEGNKKNNLVHAPGGHGSPCVFIDPDAEPEARYKLTVSVGGGMRDQGRMQLLVSADGVDWSMRKDPVVSIMNDSQSTLLRDPATKNLIMFHRPNFIVRTITQSWSDDEGLNWHGHNHWLQPDEMDRQLGIEHYALAVFPYDGCLLGLLKTYVNRWYDKRCWVELVMSRPFATYQPGEVWWRISDRTPFIGVEGEGAWDAFMMSPGHGLVPEGDGHWVYYDCWNALHTKTSGKQPHARCCIGRAFVPFRRLVEWYADETPSFIRTAPLLASGETVALDYESGDAEIRVSIQLADGSVPEGFAEADSSSLMGQSHEGRITFKGGSLARFAGVPIYLNIHMQRGARLYAFGVV